MKHSDFYAKIERQRSPERDYGCWWRWDADFRPGHWRVSLVMDTGEIVAARNDEIIILGEVQPLEDTMEVRMAMTQSEQRYYKQSISMGYTDAAATRAIAFDRFMDDWERFNCSLDELKLELDEAGLKVMSRTLDSCDTLCYTDCSEGSPARAGG